MKNPNLIGKLRAQLPDEAQSHLDSLLRFAEQHTLPLYLVGGPLRDLLLDRRSLDLDIAVEGDAMALASELAGSLSRQNEAGSARPEALVGRAANTPELRVITHPAFLTATVRVTGPTPGLGFHLDLITTRSETYARAGALPTVKPATIREDLLRRDFTINALALRLNSPGRGEILDPNGGLADLDARLIRVLHERSFQDDATRILRAFRYAVRLGFEIEPETLMGLQRDIPYIDTISGARLHHEFARILAEETPEETLCRLHEADVLAAIHPALRFEREHAEAFAHLRELNQAGARAAYWPVLAWRLLEADAVDLARRLAFTRAQRAAVEAMPALAELVSRRDAPKARLGAAGGATQPQLPLKRSALAEMLSPYPLPSLWAVAALTDDAPIRNRLLDYLTSARDERPQLTGDDLLALGIPRGPQLGEILRRLRNARLDCKARSRRDEERIVREAVATNTLTTEN